MNTHYFSPGPARLPAEVRTQIQHELLDTFGIGVSIMEISHRSTWYNELSDHTLELARSVFEIPDSHVVLFSCCGAQQHFSLLVEHLSQVGDTVSYTDTGIWATLAYQEALRAQRDVHFAYKGGPSYQTLTDYKTWKIPENSKYVHITVNNTVCGTEYSQIPVFGAIPSVLDMTSALGSRTDIPWEKTGLIYASAQKNFGIAGVSAVIMRKDLLEKSREITLQNGLGKALCYADLYDAKSIFNTPPVFPIFVMNRMLQWIRNQGGTAQMEKDALQKASLIYTQIDAGLYKGYANIQNRSRHNFVFHLPTEKQNQHFIELAEKEGLLEIKGYKNIGGIRISAYNGVSLASVQAMAQFMEHYRLRHG